MERRFKFFIQKHYLKLIADYIVFLVWKLIDLTIVVTWLLFNPRFFAIFYTFKIFIKIIRIRIGKACCVKQYNNNFLRPNNFAKAISKKANLILKFFELNNKLFSLVLLSQLLLYVWWKADNIFYLTISTKGIMHNPYCNGNKGPK